jgi:hypothetical protein
LLAPQAAAFDKHRAANDRSGIRGVRAVARDEEPAPVVG